MLQALLGGQYRYDFTERKFQIAFDFLQREDLRALEEGWIELDEGVRVSVQRYESRPAEQLDYETHEKYFDLQYMLEGTEIIGCRTREGLQVKIPYDEAADITFYEEPELGGELLMQENEFVILTPQDAHKPRCAAGKPMPIRKLVVKIPV